MYDLKGNTASSLQFFVTDSTRNFLRGSLYFNAEPNKDSLAPVMDFHQAGCSPSSQYTSMEIALYQYANNCLNLVILKTRHQEMKNLKIWV